MSDQRERVVLVTGASSGLGHECAARLIEAGFTVVGWDLHPGDDPRIAWQEVDVSSAPAVRAAAASLPPLFGAVTCAGLSDRRSAVELDPQDFERLMSVNLNGTFYTAQAAFPALTLGAGTLVTVGSVAGREAFTNRTAYCTSKAAVIMMTRCLAIEWASHGVRALCICPGFVDTGMAAQGLEQGGNNAGRIISHTPTARLTKSHEVTSVLLFALSDEASGVTGSEIYVDNGFAALGGI